VPVELGFARDPRCLGAALRRVTIQHGAKFMLVDADDGRPTAGFHDYEPAENIRWTDGSAELPIQAFARFDAGAEVVIHLGGATRCPVAGHLIISAAAEAANAKADHHNCQPRPAHRADRGRLLFDLGRRPAKLHNRPSNRPLHYSAAKGGAAPL
jgi:hypothetical protein